MRELVSVIHGDLREIELCRASVVTLYLLPESILLIEEMLLDAVRKGTIVICNTVTHLTHLTTFSF